MAKPEIMPFAGILKPIPIDRGMDSIVMREGAKVKKRFFYATGSDLELYQSVLEAAGTHLSRHPIRNSIAGIPCELKEVVHLEAIDFDNEEGIWTSLSPYIPGPHISAFLYDRRLFCDAVAELPPHEQDGLQQLRVRALLHPESFIPDMRAVLNQATSIISRVTRVKGIDIIPLNTKLRLNDKGNVRLISTDLCSNILQLAKA